jgi:hypothetical protein
MEKLIRLRSEWRDKLLARTREESPVHKLVKSGIELKGLLNMPKQVAMFCDEAGVKAILQSARKYCPQAVREIEQEIQRFREARP